MSQLFKITIEKLIHGGSGIGVSDGKRIFVPFSAPGDVLSVRVTKDHGGYAEASIEDIIEPSPCRTKPACPVFGRCGGCQWQHISYDAQLRAKRTILKEALERIGKIAEPGVFDTLPSPKQWNYRNRIQLHVDSKGRVGFYRQKSKEVVEFERCAIAEDGINDELARRRLEISARDRGISIGSFSRPEFAGSFAQVNTEQNENLKRVVAEWLSEVPHSTVFEFYAGAGNLTFPVAKVAGCVFASDVDSRAVDAARKRQEMENVCNVEFICAPADKAPRRVRGGCDVLLVDPPRKGCGEAIERIASLSPEAILYVSCDPATLARDSAEFAVRGWHLVKSLPIDMFPQTFHVESLSLFSRTAPRG
ncbi:MAG TPA: class I SAM-dependent RNA methyltransferase [bacterium]|nr:class I SAM-dependent RNA methyltransferase [bacterium]